MLPWQGPLLSWAQSTRINALGLITILGTDEVDTSVGRLVPGCIAEFLPLPGAFLLASNAFTSTQSNFVLYNLTEHMATTELAGWFTRWLKAQDLHQIHHKIDWRVKEPVSSITWGYWLALALGFCFNGSLVALTVLSADWWGLVNVSAMIVSIIVRVVLVRQNQAGIDNAIENARPPPDSVKSRKGADPARVVVIMDNSKMVSMSIPRHLAKEVFTQTPKVLSPPLYKAARAVCWAFYGAQLISIGMASLPTQICTVFVMLLATILTTYKVGCDDRSMSKRKMKRETPRDRMGERGKNFEREEGGTGLQRFSCFISSRLEAVCSEFPECYDDRVRLQKTHKESTSEQGKASSSTQTHAPPSPNQKASGDLESGPNISGPASDKAVSRTTRRQDLYIWLELSNAEIESMIAWNAMPRRQNTTWWKEFEAKRQQWKRTQSTSNGKARENSGGS